MKYKPNLMGMFFLFVALVTQSIAQRTSSRTDSILWRNYLQQSIPHRDSYPFVNPSLNYIEWEDTAAATALFGNLVLSDSLRITAVHIGDSHVQADLYTGKLRNLLQNTFGYGGRGMIFPYKSAATHAAWDYQTYSYGNWEYCRNVFKEEQIFDMGVSGVSIRTADTNAGFRIVFHKNLLPESCRVLKLYVKKSRESFGLKLRYPGIEVPLYLDNNTIDGMPYIRISLQHAPDTLEVFVNKTDTAQHHFELYGVMLESIENAGILYHSVGINGAGYKSVLKQTLMEEEIAEMKPDWVVIDLGANDFYRAGFQSSELEKDLKQIISRVKNASLKTAILIANSHDLYYRKKNITACQDFSELTRRIAFENHCAFYDYFQVSGGPKSMMSWLKYHLAKKDKVHLTTEGYHLKAEIWYQGFINSYLFYLQSAGKLPLLVAKLPENQMIKIDTLQSGKEQEEQAYVSYRVKSKETLKEIAKKFSTTISILVRINHLKSKVIHKGQNIRVPNNIGGILPNKINPPKKEVEPTIITKTYCVKKGDNLGKIAARFGVSIQKLKQLNSLTSDKIRMGMKIKIQ